MVKMFVKKMMTSEKYNIFESIHVVIIYYVVYKDEFRLTMSAIVSGKYY